MNPLRDNLEDGTGCTSPLHDWPLPRGMCWGSDDSAAYARLRNGWRQKRCPDCRKYGWIPGKVMK